MSTTPPIQQSPQPPKPSDRESGTDPNILVLPTSGEMKRIRKSTKRSSWVSTLGAFLGLVALIGAGIVFVRVEAASAGSSAAENVAKDQVLLRTEFKLHKDNTDASISTMRQDVQIVKQEQAEIRSDIRALYNFQKYGVSQSRLEKPLDAGH